MGEPSSSRRAFSVVDFYDDVLEKIFGYMKRPIDRNSISAVCKRFHEVEAKSRQHVLVYNMYAVSPMKLFDKFPSTTSITMKGNPRLVDFNILPKEWAGYAGPWIDAIKAHPQLMRFRIKRMMITDSQIEDLCSSCGPTLKILVFDKCNGFSSKGLESLAKYCKNLTTLGLAQCIFEGDTTWLSNLVDSCLNLESLDLSLVEMGDVSEDILVKLATRCKVLKVWEAPSPERFQIILDKSPATLTDLGILRINNPNTAKCTGIEGISGIFDLVEGGMEAFVTISSRLRRLDLSYSNLTEVEIAEVLAACPNLQQLRVLNVAADHGLLSLGRSCKNLTKLVVESSSQDDVGLVTDSGLIAVAQGCKNLQKLIFYPSFITNQAFRTLGENCPNLTDVRITVMMQSNEMSALPWEENLDEGVGALVQSCASLHRLTLCFEVRTPTPLLTDVGLSYIGQYAKKLRLLTLVNCGTSDAGLTNVLNGCSNLQRLEIRKCPFGDESMFEIACNVQLHLKYLFMQGCAITPYGLNSLAFRSKRTRSNFYVEVIGCRDARCIEEHGVQEQRYCLTCSHWQILAYHSLTGPRSDMPWFIQRFETTLTDDEEFGTRPADDEIDLNDATITEDEEFAEEAGLDLNDTKYYEDDEPETGIDLNDDGEENVGIDLNEDDDEEAQTGIDLNDTREDDEDGRRSIDLNGNATTTFFEAEEQGENEYNRSDSFPLESPTGIDLNEPPERDDDISGTSSIAGLSSGASSFLLPHILEGGAASRGRYDIAEPSLHLGLIPSFVLQQQIPSCE